MLKEAEEDEIKKEKRRKEREPWENVFSEESWHKKHVSHRSVATISILESYLLFGMTSHVGVKLPHHLGATEKKAPPNFYKLRLEPATLDDPVSTFRLIFLKFLSNFCIIHCKMPTELEEVIMQNSRSSCSCSS